MFKERNMQSISRLSFIMKCGNKTYILDVLVPNIKVDINVLKV